MPHRTLDYDLPNRRSRMDDDQRRATASEDMRFEYHLRHEIHNLHLYRPLRQDGAGGARYRVVPNERRVIKLFIEKYGKESYCPCRLCRSIFWRNQGA